MSAVELEIGAVQDYVVMAKHAGRYAPKTWSLPVGGERHRQLVAAGWIETFRVTVTRTGERSWRSERVA